MVNKIKIVSEECRGCHLCQLACSFYKTGAFKLSNSRITIKRDISKIERYTIAITDTCDSCGRCSEFCGYGAITLTQDRVNENG